MCVLHIIECSFSTKTALRTIWLCLMGSAERPAVVVSFAGKAALASSKVHLEETQLARKTNVVGIVVSV